MPGAGSHQFLLTLALAALLCACGGSSTDATGCKYGGQSYAVDDSFPSDDGCNTCSCASDGNVSCSARACLSCDDITSSYAEVMDQATTCDPEQTGQCTKLVVAGLLCGCETFVQPDGFDASAATSLHSSYAAASCGDGILCGACATPFSAHCSDEGRCVDDYVSHGTASCKVGGVVYPDGSGGVPDPTSCNTCTCTDGQLACTEIGCPMPCPDETKRALSCAQCGPADNCEIVEHGCLPACTDSCETGTCLDGACVSLCG